MNISTNCGTYFFKFQILLRVIIENENKVITSRYDHDLLPAAFPIDTCNTIQRAHIRCWKQ